MLDDLVGDAITGLFGIKMINITINIASEKQIKCGDRHLILLVMWIG
jgi:hypothetical protein